MMGGKLVGMRKLQSNFDKLVNDITGKRSVRAVTAAITVGASQASIYTPIDTSTLLNSQFREVLSSGTRVTGRVGYSANYAVYVNDPNRPQNFRRSSARKEFLRLGFEDARQEIDAVVRQEMFR